jgi:hypothetical protein
MTESDPKASVSFDGKPRTKNLDLDRISPRLRGADSSASIRTAPLEVRGINDALPVAGAGRVDCHLLAGVVDAHRPVHDGGAHRRADQSQEVPTIRAEP